MKTNKMKSFFLLLFAAGVPIFFAGCASSPTNDDLPRLDARFRNAYERNASPEAAKVLTEIATRFPAALSRYSDAVIVRTATSPGSAPAEEAARLALLQELFTRHWKFRYGTEPSSLWLELMRLLVERDRVNEAVKVVAHIQSVSEMIALKVDKRFDTLMRLSAPVMSVESMAKVGVENWREAMLRFPRSLEATLGFMSAASQAGQYQEALATADTAIARVAAAKSPRDVYDDAADMLPWLYNYRAIVLCGLGKWTEAEAAFRKAAEMPERGGANVNSAINLAGFYAAGGRPDDAVAALGSMAQHATRTSPYGLMQVKRALCMAAVLRKDDAEVRKQYEFMTKHRADAPGAFQAILLWTNRQDEWAQYMIERLRDPASRSAALRELQLYAEVPERPLELAMRKREREFAGRPDVRAAVAEVGIIRHFSIPPP